MNKLYNNTKASTVKDKGPEIIKLESSPTLVLSHELISQITYLHSVVGKKEWSGLLYYKVEGSPENINNMKLHGEIMHLADIGSVGTTDYVISEISESIMDFYDAHPETMNYKYGGIHTHHNMGAYFSSTDISEVKENTPLFNYYLSVVVDFAGTYVASLFFQGEETSQNIIVKGNDGKPITLTKKVENAIYEAKCKIVLNADDFLIKRAEELKEQNKKQTPLFGSHTNRKFYEPHAYKVENEDGWGKKLLNSSTNKKTSDPEVNIDLLLAQLLSVNKSSTVSSLKAMKILHKYCKNKAESFVKQRIDRIIDEFPSLLEKHAGTLNYEPDLLLSVGSKIVDYLIDKPFNKNKTYHKVLEAFENFVFTLELIESQEDNYGW